MSDAKRIAGRVFRLQPCQGDVEVQEEINGAWGAPAGYDFDGKGWVYDTHEEAAAALNEIVTELEEDE